MADLLLYSMKSAFVLILLYVPYVLLLRRETFFAFNRAVLLGMLLLGMAIIAMNIFISSLTESMVVAAVIGMAAGLVIDTMSSFSKLVPIPWVQFVLEKIDFLNYYTNFTYGILSIVDVIFFLSVTGLFLFFTVRVLERRRWS